MVGLRRRGHSRDVIRRTREVYRSLFESGGAFRERLETTAARFADDPVAGKIIAFIRDGGSRPLMMPAQNAGDGLGSEESAMS